MVLCAAAVVVCGAAVVVCGSAVVVCGAAVIVCGAAVLVPKIIFCMIEILCMLYIYIFSHIPGRLAHCLL